MKKLFIVSVISLLAAAMLAGCAGAYKTWSSGKAPGAAVVETSKNVPTYTLEEGNAEEFSVANYFVSNMIVPRDRCIEIWGTAPEEQNGKVVAAEFKGLKGSGVIENGAFSFVLQGTLPASVEKGHNLVVRGAAGTEIAYSDVLVGDIWIVSGQSNADLTFYGTVPQSTQAIKNLYDDYLNEATAEDNIRVLQQINWSLKNASGANRMRFPQTDLGKTIRWTLADRKRVYGNSATNSFSMLGYFFAKELYKLNPDVPIGIAMAACGGAPLSLLASPDAVEAFPESLKHQTLDVEGTVFQPSSIYNAFMAPLTHVGIAGIIFYQGESNTTQCEDYVDALKILVEDYREKFGSDLLFLNVQLTSYGYDSGGITLNGGWDFVPDMRFAQSLVKIDGSISNYEIIPSIDVGWRKGDADGAHPYYKYELGLRGAQIAAAKIYGISTMEDAAFPVPSRITYNNAEIVIEYDYAGGGLKTLDGSRAQGFEVKKGDSWEKTAVTIDGNKVIISASRAAGVRYAPELRYFTTNAANLCSGTGNIAVPFCVEFE